MTIRTNVHVTSPARSDVTGGTFRAPMLPFRTSAGGMYLLQWRSAARRALATIGLIVGGLSLWVQAYGQEVPARDSPPPFFATLKSQATLLEGVTISERMQDRLALESGGSDYRFIEYLSWHQLRLTFDLNRIADPEVVLTTFRAIKAIMKRACGEGLLELNQAEPKIGGFALGRDTDGFMTTSYRSLSAEGLVGSFSCRKNGAPDGPPWRVQWDSGNRYPLAVAPANEWRFLIEGVGQDTFWRHRLRFDAHRRATDTLRSNAKVGAVVQVMSDEVPEALLARLPKLVNSHKQPYAVCALVTNLNPPLAQLQVQLENFMIPIQRVFPPGRQVNAKEIGQHLDQKEPAQQACLL